MPLIFFNFQKKYTVNELKLGALINFPIDDVDDARPSNYGYSSMVNVRNCTRARAK